MRQWIGAAILQSALLTTSLSFAGEHLTIDKVPAPVRATVERETKGGNITSIETDHEDGVLMYEVEFTVGGKAYELDIGADGKLLEKRLD